MKNKNLNFGTYVVLCLLIVSPFYFPVKETQAQSAPIVDAIEECVENVTVCIKCGGSCKVLCCRPVVIE